MTCLVDTNILLRFSNPLDAAHTTVLGAVRVLQAAGMDLLIVPQNVYEFWVVGTRPSSITGSD